MQVSVKAIEVKKRVHFCMVWVPEKLFGPLFKSNLSILIRFGNILSLSPQYNSMILDTVEAWERHRVSVPVFYRNEKSWSRQCLRSAAQKEIDSS